ncbi:MAG: HAD family hydrolase [Bacillota bacterium]|nr:HAD family hydrolase [Bacillota bacterium]
MIKAVVFDFDGLIVDTESVWFEAFKDVLHHYGLQLELDHFSKVIGTNDTVLYSFIQENSKQEVDIAEIKSKAHSIFHEKMGQPFLREGVKEYLETAKTMGLKIGLASSSTRQWVEGYLEALEIHHYFETICTRDDVNQVKPDPELYLLAVKKLGVAPDEVLAFEDSLNGLLAARKAGLYCAIVPNLVTAHLPFEDFHFRLESMAHMSLNELINLLVL